MPFQMGVQIKLPGALDMYLNKIVNLHISIVAIPCSQLSYSRFSFGFLSLFILCTSHHTHKYYLLLIPGADVSNTCWSQYFLCSLHLLINRIHVLMWFKPSCYSKEISTNVVTAKMEVCGMALIPNT